jgi:signal transduction histidine kinase
MALTPEVLIPRVGDVLVEQGLITKEQLLEALEKQKQERAQGKSPLLGQIMREMGFLDQQTLDQAITQQILKLQNSLKEANETLEKRVQQRTAELEEAYKKLSELNNLKANFISNISHELRTPLTHILGYLDLMYGDGIDNLHADQKESLEIIHKASERLGHLIEDLILFSTSEVGGITLEKETFDIRAVLKDVVNKADGMINKKKVVVTINAPDTAVAVNADRSKIFWVINQLLDNGIKFNQNGGKVTLSVASDGSKARISVEDSGIGIESEKMTEIFEPFHQIDGSSTRKQGGTGIGLTLAQKIVEAHGEQLNVVSIPGKGSTFSFLLDRA